MNPRQRKQQPGMIAALYEVLHEKMLALQ